MSTTAIDLRAHLYRYLDCIAETGEVLEMRRKRGGLKISRKQPGSLLKRLPKRPTMLVTHCAVYLYAGETELSGLLGLDTWYGCYPLARPAFLVPAMQGIVLPPHVQQLFLGEAPITFQLLPVQAGRQYIVC